MGVLNYNFFGSGGGLGGGTFYFCIPNLTATSTDVLYSGNGGPFVAGDSKISSNGGAFANTTNLVTQASGKVYSLTLTSAELGLTDGTLGEIVAVISDQDGPVFGDVVINIHTQLLFNYLKIQTPGGSSGPVTLNGGTSTVPTVFIGNSGNALPGIGFGTGNETFGALRSGIVQAATGTTITLDAGASAIDNFYNEAAISITANTGAGQARTIVSYVGATKIATVNRAWTTNPAVSSGFVITRGGDVWDQLEGTQPAVGAILNNATFRVIWQYLKRRFLGKTTQTATLQTIFQDDSATPLTTMVCSSDGVTQTKGKSS